MQSSNLFNHTRRHLTFWYAGVMGTIILAFGALAHTLLIQLAERSVDQDLALLSGTFRDSLEGTFKEPGIISKPEAEQLLPGFCLPDCNESHLRQRLSSLQARDYYVRLLDLSGHTLGALGDRSRTRPLTQSKVPTASPTTSTPSDSRPRTNSLGAIYKWPGARINSINT
jgi:hypothetical protein